MKRSCCLSLLLALSFFSSGSEPAAKSLLPASLSEQTFLFTVDSNMSVDNPNAGCCYLMRFEAGRYRYQIIGTDKIIEGEYSYNRHSEKLGTEIGVITMSERFKGEESAYQMVLLPKDQAAGLYLFKQVRGPELPNLRLNSARYTRIIL